MRKSWPILNPNRPLLWGWYNDVVCDHLEALWRGIIRRLLIIIPPGSTKSTIASVCFPAHVWVHDPAVRFLIASNSDDLSSRDSLACRRLVLSDWYENAYRRDKSGNLLWGLRADQNEKEWYETTRTGHRQALTVAKTVSGKKGDIIIADDPNDAKMVGSRAYRKNVHEWYSEAFFNRVDDFKTSRHLIIGMRTHVEDLQSNYTKDKDWVVLSLPERGDLKRRSITPLFTDMRADGEWLRPERFGEEEEKTAVKVMKPSAYAAQHLCRPEKRGDKMFDRDKCNPITAVPIGTRAVRFWDTAATKGESACFTSGVLMGTAPSGRTVIIHEKRGRWNPAERNLIMKQCGFADMSRTYFSEYRMYFEKGASDSGVERDANLIIYLAGLPVYASPSRGDKEQRAEPFSCQWEAGNVDYVVGDWNDEYFDAMEGFPSATMKDTTDASSGAYNNLVNDDGTGEVHTAEEEETELGRLPSGTFRNRNY